ncbi:ATP-binding protein [Halanaerobacter jeridensis]|uniref:Anti-sigma regulatory factor (Ser/Thr protein kinase) n=1 Tax=Halanaerobacter jeridensis TaxID=706427 RepID=A0A939BS44_9FIRM|nr:anti-sigma regulatory factor (Ser/Thr protein kinase) [Halanaerobacter jeridensis]
MPSIKLPATIENLDRMLEFVVNGVNHFEIATENSLKKLRLVCEEMLTNIIDYSYPKQTGEVKIIYKVVTEEKKVIIKIIDHGVPFNPVEYKKPNLSASIEERDIGGLGIHIAKRIVDQMKYQRNEEQNVLTIVKFIN